MNNTTIQTKCQNKTELMIKKVNTLLIENKYMQAQELAKRCHVKIFTIFRIIRLLRLKNIGVIATKNGYILSEFASQQDDVHFIRSCYGRRLSDYIAIQASKNDIDKRWKGEIDRKALAGLLGPIDINLGKISGGIKLLSEVSDRITV